MKKPARGGLGVQMGQVPKDHLKKPDWLDKASNPDHGSSGMWGFLGAIALVVGGVAVFLLAWFGR